MNARAGVAIAAVVAAGIGLPILDAGTATAAPSGHVHYVDEGTSAPLATVGGYPMTQFPLDTRGEGAPVTSVPGPSATAVSFAPVQYRFDVSDLNEWEQSYAGAIYDAGGFGSTTITLPANTVAFSFYALPNDFGTYEVTAQMDDGTSATGMTSAVPGSGGHSRGFAFYADAGATLGSITVSNNSRRDTIIGEFGIAVAPYTVSFDAAGGSPAPAAQAVESGGHASEPVAPSKTGYSFRGWYTPAGDLFDFGTDVVTADLTLTARYAIDSFTVSFDAAGGLPAPAAQTVDYGEFVVEPAAPSKTGYTFTGWYTAAGDLFDFASDAVTADLTLTARYAIDSYTVSFDAAGGSPAPAAQTVDYGGHATEPTAPDKTGYTFTGWYTAAGDLFDFGTNPVTADLTLTARYTEITLTVTDANGTVIPDGSQLDRGQQVTLTVTGLEPGTDYAVTARSAPVGLATFTTDAAGAGNVSVTIPVSLDAGVHHLTVDTTSAGNATVASFAFTLAALTPTPTPTPTSTPTPTPTPTSTSPAPTASAAPSSAPSSTVPVVSSGASPAVTGSDVAGLVALAGLLLAIGVGLVTVSGRRRARH